MDEATTKIRAAWPGHIRIVPVRAADASVAAPRVEISAARNDAVDAGLALAGVKSTTGSVRVVRGRTTAADSAWARGDGRILVHWPAGADDADWAPRQTIDAIGGVTSATATLVARFPRVWVLQGTTIARWADGFGLDSDRSAFHQRIARLWPFHHPGKQHRANYRVGDSPKGCLLHVAARLTRPVSATMISAPAGNARLASASAVRDPTTVSSPWTVLLLALGAVLLVAELALRRSTSRSRVA
jgi:hypothetical protein